MNGEWGGEGGNGVESRRRQQGSALGWAVAACL
jgi:hypothetical protein